ncbi:MAG: Lrp/AsnC family transcriptional regulator [Dehalococcoidia bacterium]|nr:Lrp/AsnC family transcriptional regulator [Dehalococcoidia bacterium]
MPTRAYVLVETAVGKTREVLQAVKKIQGIETVDAVTGPFDLIITVQASDLNAVGDLVTSRIHTIGGIVRTTTCLAVSL